MEWSAWRKRVTGAAVVLVMLSTSGCVTEWVPLRASAMPFRASSSSCDIEAAEQWPVKNEVASRTVYVEHLERCREEDKSKCDVDGKYNRVQLPEIESYVMDANESSRDNEYMGCMGRSGWIQHTRWIWSR